MKWPVIVAIVLALLVYLPPRSQADESAKKVAQGCSNQYEAVTITEAKEASANYEQKSTTQKPPRWYQSSEWILVIVAGVTGVIIGWQSYETRRATNSQRSKDRARLAFTGFRDNESLGNDDLRQPYWSISILLQQHGPTKAFNVQGLGAIIVKRADEPRPLVSRKRMARLHDISSIVEGVNGDKSPIIEPAIGFAALKDADMGKIDAGELRAHFFGFVEYDDVFGAKHTTKFRYVWQPEIREQVPGEPGETFQLESKGWQLSGRKKDNYAD